MKNNNKLIEIIQCYLKPETIKKICIKNKYEDKARKFTVREMIKHFIMASICGFKSFRETEILSQNYYLLPIDFTTFSKKTKEVPYEIIKELFENLIKNINHKQKRFLEKKLKIKAIDSTLITFSKKEVCDFADYRKDIQGIKIHVSYDIENSLPENIVISSGKKHDSKLIDKFRDKESILVCDRAYVDINKFNEFEKNTQYFVTRIKKNMIRNKKHSLKRILESSEIEVLEDYTCVLGDDKKFANKRLRIVTFKDTYDNKISVCTNIMNISGYEIAKIYRSRWQIEVFFRFIKQNLNVKNLFGKNKNSILNQLYCGLIGYLIILFSFNKVAKCPYFNFSVCEFIRYLVADSLREDFFYYLLN